jgi:hypothetical protein
VDVVALAAKADPAQQQVASVSMLKPLRKNGG